MFATVQWTDHKGGYHDDVISEPTDLAQVLNLIEGKGGTVSKYNRIPKLGRNTMAPRITTTPLEVRA